MKNNISTGYQNNKQKANNWISSKSEGNEKLWIIVMLLIAVSFTAYSVYDYMDPEKEKQTIGDTFDTLKISDDIKNYDYETYRNESGYTMADKAKDEEALILIEIITEELTKKVKDTAKIKTLLKELDDLNIKL